MNPRLSRRPYARRSLSAVAVATTVSLLLIPSVRAEDATDATDATATETVEAVEAVTAAETPTEADVDKQVVVEQAQERSAYSVPPIAIVGHPVTYVGKGFTPGERVGVFGDLFTHDICYMDISSSGTGSCTVSKVPSHGKDYDTGRVWLAKSDRAPEEERVYFPAGTGGIREKGSIGATFAFENQNVAQGSTAIVNFSGVERDDIIAFTAENLPNVELGRATANSSGRGRAVLTIPESMPLGLQSVRGKKVGSEDVNAEAFINVTASTGLPPASVRAVPSMVPATANTPYAFTMDNYAIGRTVGVKTAASATEFRTGCIANTGNRATCFDTVNWDKPGPQTKKIYAVDLGDTELPMPGTSIQAKFTEKSNESVNSMRFYQIKEPVRVFAADGTTALREMRVGSDFVAKVRLNDEVFPEDKQKWGLTYTKVAEGTPVSFNLLASALSTNRIPVGEGVVDSNGELTATLSVPAHTPFVYGGYLLEVVYEEDGTEYTMHHQLPRLSTSGIAKPDISVFSHVWRGGDLSMTASNLGPNQEVRVYVDTVDEANRVAGNQRLRANASGTVAISGALPQSVGTGAHKLLITRPSADRTEDQIIDREVTFHVLGYDNDNGFRQGANTTMLIDGLKANESVTASIGGIEVATATANADGVATLTGITPALQGDDSGLSTLQIQVGEQILNREVFVAWPAPETTPVETTTGSLTWGIRDSFRHHMQKNGFGLGGWKLNNVGYTDAEEFEWNLRAESPTKFVANDPNASVRITSYEGAMNHVFAAPEIEVTGDNTATLSMLVSRYNYPFADLTAILEGKKELDRTNVLTERIDVALLTFAEPIKVGADGSFEGTAKATVPAAAEDVYFAYNAGDSLADVTVRLAATGEDTTAPSAAPSTTPSVTANPEQPEGTDKPASNGSKGFFETIGGWLSSLWRWLFGWLFRI